MKPGDAFDMDAALRLFRAGRSLADIGAALGCCAHTVKDRLVEAGVAVRDGRLVYPEVSVEDLHALYLAGAEPLGSIARRLGTTPQRILGRLRTARLLAKRPHRSGYLREVWREWFRGQARGG